MSAQQILVTGGAGFIGSNLIAALAEQGESVVVCDWLGRDERWRNIARHDIADLVIPEALPEWLRGRVGGPGAGSELSAVVHLGALTSTTEQDVERLVRYNVRATLDLLQWCTLTHTPFIYASSAATYGDGSAGFDDEGSGEALGRLRPLNAYGWSKHVVDRRIARLVAEGAELPPQWAGLKFFNVYGPNEYHKGSMCSLVARSHPALVRGEPLRLFRSERPDYPDGGQCRDFIYVRDCIDVILWLLRRPQVCGLFNVGTGRARSWLDLGHALFAALGREPRIEFVALPEALRGRYQYFTEARMSRLRAAGYEPEFTSLEAGVTEYVQRYLSREDPYR